MSDAADTARKALAIYLSRGRDALALLDQGRIDDANALLRRRTAAFHDFRAVDALAIASGIDIASEPAVQDVWTQITVVDAALKTSLEKAHHETAELYRKVKEARAKLGAFRSEKGGTPPRFEKTA